MKTRILIFALALCLMIGMLAACSDGTDGTDGTYWGDTEGDGGNADSQKSETPITYDYAPTQDGRGYVITAAHTGTHKSVRLPASYEGKAVLAIAANAFSNSALMTELTIPDSIETIGENAFVGCAALQKVSIGSGVKSIGAYAFFKCAKLNAITVSEYNTVYKAVGNCLIDVAAKKMIAAAPNCSIPDDGSVNTIAEGAFGFCEIGSINLTKNITKIEANAFYSCTVVNFYFDGTMDEWNAVVKEEGWSKETLSFRIVCSDGNAQSPETVIPE